MMKIPAGDVMDALAEYLCLDRYTLERALMQLVRDFENGRS